MNVEKVFEAIQEYIDRINDNLKEKSFEISDQEADVIEKNREKFRK